MCRSRYVALRKVCDVNVWHSFAEDWWWHTFFFSPGDRLSKQDRLPRYTDPVITCKELEEKRVHVETAALVILNKPKPEPAKTEPPKADATNAEAPKPDTAPKADAPKADAPKADAPKPDAKADGHKSSGKK